MSRRLLASFITLVLAAGVAAATVGSPRSSETYRAVAYFPKAIGLFEESDVSVLGVPVGKVTAVTPEGDRVKVAMEIERRHRVPADASARIVPISLISDRYVQLDPPYAGGPVLKDGAVIPIERTSIPAELDDLLAGLKRFLDALEAGSEADPGALGDAIANLSRALAGTSSDLSATLQGAGGIAGAVNGKAPELDSLVVHLSGFLQALGKRQTEITAINTHLASALGGIAEVETALDGALINLAVLTEQMGSLIQDHRQILEADLAVLAKTTQAVVRQKDSIERADQWLQVLADGISDTNNGGAVHTFGGVTHIDVRDAHYGTCPPEAAAFCAALGDFGAAGAASSMPAIPAAAASSQTAIAPAPDRPPLIGPLPLDVRLPEVHALGDQAAPAARPSFGDRIASWFVALGRLIGELFR